MAIIPILAYPNSRLYQKAIQVTDVHSDVVQTMIKDMFETLAHTDNCAGLAATQLDFASPFAITVLHDYSDDGSQPLCLINPIIIASSGEQREAEGCMSVYPDLCHERVKRAETITVTALTDKGDSITYTANGYVAKLIQHEVDHLNGLLYLQRLSALKRQRLDLKIAKAVLDRKA